MTMAFHDYGKNVNHSTQLVIGREPWTGFRLTFQLFVIACRWLTEA